VSVRPTARLRRARRTDAEESIYRYESDESGQFEIYVRPFPDVNSGRWLVSSGSGTEPLWSPAGSEIFYRALDGGLMSVPVSDEDGFSVGNPSVVVAGSYYEGTECCGDECTMCHRTGSGF
jgi:hypothetical protein